MIDKPFRWHVFQDGYRELVRGYDKVERQHMEQKHGPLVNILTCEEADKINSGRCCYETVAL